MNGLRGAGLVALRELTEAFRRKSFWAIVAIMFVGSTAAMVIPSFVGGAGTTTYTVAVDRTFADVRACAASRARALQGKGRGDEGVGRRQRQGGRGRREGRRGRGVR